MRIDARQKQFREAVFNNNKSATYTRFYLRRIQSFDIKLTCDRVYLIVSMSVHLCRLQDCDNWLRNRQQIGRVSDL